MAETGGNITWFLDADTKKFDTALKKASVSAEQTAADGEKHFGKLGGFIAGAAKAGAVALGVAAAASITFGVKSAASFEQTRIGLENMLGSAEAAKKVLSDVSKFAAETPFEFPELAQATRQLVAFGFSGQEAFDTMKQLGDVSAAVGAPINDLAYLMGTLRTQGRAFTIDIRQFAQRGIPIYEYLAKVLNKNTQEITAMIEAGQIGFPEVQKAFQAMTAEGGKFHNTMAKQSQSLSGLWSTLKDVLGQTARELVGISQTGDVIKGSLFDKIRNGVAKAIEVLPVFIDNLKDIGNKAEPIFSGIKKAVENLMPSFRALANTISSRVFPAIHEFITVIRVNIIPILGGALVGAIKLAVDALNALLTAVTPLFSFFMNNAGILVPIIAAFASLRIALAIDTAINAVIIAFNTLKLVTIPSLLASFSALAAFLMTPMGAALAAIALGTGILISLFKSNATQADVLRESTNMLRDAQNALKDSTDRLRGAEITEEGAKLALERAQKTYNDAVRQYGPASLEAREAHNRLRQAEVDVKRAADDTKKAMDEQLQKQKEVASYTGLNSALSTTTGFFNALRDSASGAAGQINRVPGSGAINAINGVGRNAAGTDYWRGGPTWVGERGPEIVNLPRGSQVIPNHKIGGAGNVTNNIGNINVDSNYRLMELVKAVMGREQEVAQLGMLSNV